MAHHHSPPNPICKSTKRHKNKRAAAVATTTTKPFSKSKKSIQTNRARRNEDDFFIVIMYNVNKMLFELFACYTSVKHHVFVKLITKCNRATKKPLPVCCAAVIRVKNHTMSTQIRMSMCAVDVRNGRNSIIRKVRRSVRVI